MQLRKLDRIRGRKRFLRLGLEALEPRCVQAVDVLGSEVSSIGSWQVTIDWSEPIAAASLDVSDLTIDGLAAATAVSALDADTSIFTIPAQAAGSYTLAIAGGTVSAVGGSLNNPFSRSIVVASAPQYSMKHAPRMQPGNAPLTGYAGSELDRVDVLWQTIPGGTGTQGTFLTEYRAAGSSGAWSTATVKPTQVTNVENRVVHTASITGLNWNSDYDYRVRKFEGDIVTARYENSFRTRLNTGDQTSFTFAAYGDSASGTATGFRQVQSRINQVDPAFSVLLGDNVYNAGSHTESDSRFDPNVNPEAAAWMAQKIDYLGLGNHDVGTGSGLPSEQNYSVPIPVAGVTSIAAPPATERPEHSFSWDYGNVHFVTFDTNSLATASRLDGLLDWVTADLNASTARWKIVYGHHPLAGVPDKTESPSGDYFQQVVNRLKGAGVDLFMTGHSHTYSRTYPLSGQVNGTATIEDHDDNHYHAGVGLPQLVSGVGGVEIRPGTYTQFPFVAAGFTSATPTPARLGFSRIAVTPNSLTIDYVAANNGDVIDSYVIEKDPDLQTVSFQQGVNGYTGTVDTFIQEFAPTVASGAATSLNVDLQDPNLKKVQALLRFDNLAATIPNNAILRSATLELQVTNPGASMNLHRMARSWSGSDTWNTLTGGVQTDGIDALAAADVSTGRVRLGKLSFNVVDSLQAWQTNPASNFGWLLNMPTGTDGVDFHSAEGTTKPKLLVTYVIPANQNPIAEVDNISLDEDTTLFVAAATNDHDPDTDPVSIVSTQAASFGMTQLQPDGTIRYVPNANFFGFDQFRYVISDARGGTATGTVSVTVNPVNDPPSVLNDSASTSGTTPVQIAVLTNDSDVENDTLTPVLTVAPSNGTVTLNPNGTFTYVAAPNFQGIDIFQYQADDGTNRSVSASVSVSVTGGTKFFTVDNSTDRMYRYSASGSLVSNAILTNGNSVSKGITGNADGSITWVIDSSGKVFVYGASQQSLGSWTASGLKSPTGIALVGNDLWIVDSTADRSYRYAGAATRRSGTVAATSSFVLASGNSNPQDIAADATTAWVVQSSNTDRVYVYRLADGVLLGQWNIDPLNSTPTGITFDPSGASTSLWTVDRTTRRVYEYVGAKTRLTGSQTAAGSFALNSANVAPEGLFDPVPSLVDSPLLAGAELQLAASFAVAPATLTTSISAGPGLPESKKSSSAELSVDDYFAAAGSSNDLL